MSCVPAVPAALLLNRPQPTSLSWPKSRVEEEEQDQQSSAPQRRRPGNTVATARARRWNQEPFPGLGHSGRKRVHHAHPTQQGGSQQKGGAEGAAPKDAVPPGAPFSLSSALPLRRAAWRRAESCWARARGGEPSSCRPRGRRSRAGRAGATAPGASSRADGPWKAAAPVKSSVLLCPMQGRQGARRGAVWSPPGGTGSLGRLQSDSPRRGDPWHQKRMEVGYCSLKTQRWLLLCAASIGACDGQTVAPAPQATTVPSARPGVPGGGPRKPPPTPLLPALARRAGLSTAPPPRSPPSRGPRAPPRCRWSGRGGCGISWPASGAVSAR